jgi:hypothetical protein
MNLTTTVELLLARVTQLENNQVVHLKQIEDLSNQIQKTGQSVPEAWNVTMWYTNATSLNNKIDECRALFDVYGPDIRHTSLKRGSMYRLTLESKVMVCTETTENAAEEVAFVYM